MIIGMMGLAGTGKSTVGRILRDEYGFIPIAFADALKDGVSVLFNWERRLIEGDTPESREFRETPDAYWTQVFQKPVTPRWVLQYMGTEVIRGHLHNDFWILATGKRMQDKSKSYVITDARFPNEFEWIKSQEGFLVEIQNTRRAVEWLDSARRNAIAIDATEGDAKRLWQTCLVDEMKRFNVHPSEYEHVVWRVSNSVDYALFNDFEQIQNDSTLSMLKASVTHMMRVFTGPKDQKAIKNQTLDTNF